MIPDLDPCELIDGYLDDALTADQQEELSTWIKVHPDHARTFAEAMLLHDRLRNTLAAYETPVAMHRSSTIESRRGGLGGSWLMSSVARTTAAAAVLILGLATLWFSIGTQTASAAIRELDRIIVNSMRSKDRTFEIVVEDITTERRGKRSAMPESQRPPKPPLDGAALYVRSGNQFVLVRKTQEGLPFVTGSNGQQSWAINTRGPVRVSADVHCFDHDLPGHETSVPLTNLHEGLQQLKVAYELTFSALGPEEYETGDGHEARLLIAVKKRKERGPQRVEIVYDAISGGILRMRFVQMPYGPDFLDLRLSLVSQDELSSDFFEHTSHHVPDRKIEEEN
ncbi:MAG: hypothetical protein NTU79_23965 [Planctomycetota bacterium]|nr:hypothetical protein [Planctomycetota bacterium]